MLLNSTDIKQYQDNIKIICGKNIYELDEFEKCLQEALNIDTSIRVFLANILRAINISNNIDRDRGINSSTDISILLQCNICKNKKLFLSHKENSSFQRYLKNIDQNNLEILCKLSNLFDKQYLSLDKLSFNDNFIESKNSDTVSSKSDALLYDENSIQNLSYEQLQKLARIVAKEQQRRKQ